MSEKNKNFYLGLDIGTDSCGWALTDEDYNVVRVKGKHAWGVRLFDNAKVAQERRMRRTARRRLQRKRLQSMWLREVFEDEIKKIDPLFFDRLKYSNLFREDKELMGVNGKYSLFNDVLKDVYTDWEYYKEYKTVYHLRKKLLDVPADDVRLLYLAVHSFLTHRGHFLYETSAVVKDDEVSLYNILVEKLDNLEFENEQNFNLQEIDGKIFNNLYEDIKNGLSIRELKENFVEYIGAKSKREKDVAKILITGKFKLKDLFDVDKEDDQSVDFSSEEYSDKVYGEIVEILGDDEKVSIIDLFQDIFNLIQRKKLMGDHEYICQAMVAKYEIHQEQLKELKNFISKYYPSKKSYVFRISDDNVCNYAHYVYQTQTGGKKREKRTMDKMITKSDFYSFLKKIFNEQPETPVDEDFEKYKAKFLNLMEKGDFLQKIRSHENTVLPNSEYMKELGKILEQSANKFDFLTKIDESGLNGVEKIKQIIQFRIPYFVGPIGASKPEFSWVEKKKDISLRPWNLKEIVDFNESDDKFIQRMTNKCTYLKSEDVLPKDSILYSKFRVLNELNNLKIDGDSISVEVKQSIFNNLFKKEKKVSIKKLKNFLVAENIISQDAIQDVSITGVDKEFANNYASFVVFSNKFGEEFVEKNIDVFEKIIKYHTIISDKNRLQERLKREFEFFSDDDIKWLKSLNFSKWGRLSKKFLSELCFYDKRNQESLDRKENFSNDYIEKQCNGECCTVIEAMWETNNNLQQLFDSHNYTLAEMIESFEQKLNRELTYLDVDELYCSPVVKRGAWQAIKIVEEIKSAIGKYPDKIFVEVTRHDGVKGDKGRKDSRKKILEKLYNDSKLKEFCDKQSIEYNKLMNELNGKTVSDLRSDKLFLYFLQLGKCMYTGNPIELNDLYNDDIYNVDHIIPQSRIKDDSLNNKVLVKMIANKEKDDFYPISDIRPEWQIKQKPFWHILKERGLLSTEKLSRLERTEPFDERAEVAFVNRQLVETNQEAKAVIDLLRRVVDNSTNIIFSKANIVSDFRKRFDIYKSREVNSLHHAKDAYLNVVVGNVVYNRFTEKYYDKKNPDKNTKEHVTHNYSKIFEGRVWSCRDASLVWDGETGRYISTVKEQCEKNDCLFSVMPFVKNNGMFYDETVYKSRKNDSKTKASFSLKGEGKILSDIDKYGGYNSVKNAYFMIVETIDKKGKLEKMIEAVPIIIEYKYRNDPNKQEKIMEYLEKQSGEKINKVLVPVLKYKSTLKINGAPYTLTGKTGNGLIIWKQAQWYIGSKAVGYIKAIEKYLEMSDEKKDKLEKGDDYIIVSQGIAEKTREIRLTAQENVSLYDLAIQQLSKKIYDLSPIKGVLNTLVTSREKFIPLDVESQAKQLREIVRYIGGAYYLDLTQLGGSKKAGTTAISKNITNLDVRVVMQSTAGLNKKEIRV